MLRIREERVDIGLFHHLSTIEHGDSITDLRDDAQTINQPGLTLVPLDVRFAAGDVIIRAKDPRYATPGPDEAQKFSR